MNVDSIPNLSLVSLDVYAETYTSQPLTSIATIRKSDSVEKRRRFARRFELKNYSDLMSTPQIDRNIADLRNGYLQTACRAA